ncbi:MAG: sigma 54-interacting transcriptional regulator [Polyangiaceae bacterium]
MSAKEESVVTAHHSGASEPDGDVLCATVFTGATSFTYELPSTGRVTLGRGSDVDLQAVGAGVSRVHGTLEVSGTRAKYRDEGSRNGSFVDGLRIDGAIDVGPGTELRLGEVRFALQRRASLPPSVVPVLVRRAWLEGVTGRLATGASVAVFVLEFAERWWDVDPLPRTLGALGARARVGCYSDRILAFAVTDDPAAADAVAAAYVGALRNADVDVRTAPARSGPRSASTLLDEALGGLLSSPPDETGGRDKPVAVDPKTVALLEEAARIAPSRVGVLLTGETGAGKEVFARWIHEKSGRTGPLVSVNAAALPEALLESELFGHERGAFSGATQAKPGLVESADGGTLFLDEIGELPMSMQAKLLRVLEDHVVRRVGATKERSIDLRVVAATNCDLERSVVEKSFRSDLLFRINACTLAIPPLRDRPGDVPALVERFLRSASKGVLVVSPEAMALLASYAWPGNVRELRNVVERAAALATSRSDSMLRPEDLPGSVRERDTSSSRDDAPAVGSRDAVRNYERDRIVDALAKAEWNQTHAAEALGLPRRTLAYKMSRLGIRVPSKA